MVDPLTKHNGPRKCSRARSQAVVFGRQTTEDGPGGWETMRAAAAPARALGALLFSTASLVTCSVPASELAALSDLYFATGGPTSWTNRSGWSSLDDAGGDPSDPCTWFGVTCTEEEGGEQRVAGLDLANGQGSDGNGLDGSLPESIGNLTRVKVGVTRSIGRLAPSDCAAYAPAALTPKRRRRRRRRPARQRANAPTPTRYNL